MPSADTPPTPATAPPPVAPPASDAGVARQRRGAPIGSVWALGLAGLAMPVLLLAGPDGPAAGLAWPYVLAAAAVLAVLGPGWLLIDVFLPRRAATDVLERIALVLGAGFAHAILAGLLLHDLPGPITVNRLVALHGFALLLYAVAAWRRGAAGRPRPVPARTWAQVALVLVLAAGLRLPHVGWSEFQGDEAIVLTKAAAAVEGRDDAHYIHKKGPAEILLTAQVYALQERVDETRARLPFTFATLAGLLALFVVGRGLFGGTAATIAALALGLNGFFIAFARIVQYQGVVFLLSTLALWCFLRLRGAERDKAEPDERDAPAWILLAALLLAAGLLAHYDAGLVAPALLWLLVRRWRTQAGAWRRDLPWVGAATVLGTVLLGAFYAPLARHPYFQSTTLPYLLDVRLGGGDEERSFFHNTLTNSATLAAFYTPALVLLVWCFGLGAEFVRRLRAWLPAPSSAVASVLFVLGSAAILLRPTWFQWGAFNGTILFVGAVALAGLAVRGPDDGWKAVWLWLMVPFVFYVTMVESPRTHVHTAFPAWSLLMALPLAALWRGRWRPWDRTPDTLAAHDRSGTGAPSQPPSTLGQPTPDLATSPSSAAFSSTSPLPPTSLPSSTTSRAVRLGLVLAGVALYAYGARYAVGAFLDRGLEYRRGWPETRMAGYWMPYPDLPSSGWFGFPYRAGWKTVGVLFSPDVPRGSDETPMIGDYDSNEEQPVTAWYTRGMPRCDVAPRFVFVAEDVQDVRPIPEDLGAAGYRPTGYVQTMGQTRIVVWELLAASSAEVQEGSSLIEYSDDVLSLSLAMVDPATALGATARAGGLARPAGAPPPFSTLEDGFSAAFDRDASGPSFETMLPYGDPLRFAPNPVDIDLGGRARLRGWRVEHGEVVVPGGQVVLSLWWEATAELDKDYSVFAHVEREGERLVGQHDGTPHDRDAKGVCGPPRPTTMWRPGDVIVDRRVIEIDPDAPRGGYSLLVGLYDYETLERLEVRDVAGNPAGNRVDLGVIEVVVPKGAALP